MKTPRRPAALLAAAALLLLPFLAASPARTQAPTPVPDDRLIVPGQRIGRWSLEAAIPDLIRAAGPPSVLESTDANRRPLTVLVWAPPGIAAVTRDRSKVDFLYLYGGDHRTAQNIGRGSSADEVRRAYSRPELTNLGASRAMVFDRLGLAFLITPQRVSAVFVFPPGTSDTLRVPPVLPLSSPGREGPP